jgi:hypothetical protein
VGPVAPIRGYLETCGDGGVELRVGDCTGLVACDLAIGSTGNGARGNVSVCNDMLELVTTDSCVAYWRAIVDCPVGVL